MQKYQHLGLFLKQEMAASNNPYAINSMFDQHKALQILYKNQLSETEIAARVQRLNELKTQFNALITDNRLQYTRQTVRAASRLTQLREVA